MKKILIPIILKKPTIDERFPTYESANGYNLINNGNFNDGNTGWTNSGSALSASNNILSIIGDGTSTAVRAYQNLGLKPIISKIYWIKIKLKVTNNSNPTIRAILRDGLTGTAYITQQNSAIQNQIYTLQNIITITNNFTNNGYILIDHNYSDVATANGKVMEVQEVILIDITNY